MKLHLLKRTSDEQQSFSVRLDRYPHFLKVWHHHEAIELVRIKKSTGTLFLGDAIVHFKLGDVVLIGKNLPHMWLNDQVYFRSDRDLIAEAVAVHFKEDFLGRPFFGFPELHRIKKLLAAARFGIKFREIPKSVHGKIDALLGQKDFRRLVLLLEILQELSTVNYRQLVSSGFTQSLGSSKNEVLDKTYDFIYNNFDRTISAKDVANAVGMNASAFSRFFKRIHQKSFTKYLNELRIGFACKLLMEDKLSITAICFDCGFNNISNFNRQFKKIKGISPSRFKKNTIGLYRLG